MVTKAEPNLGHGMTGWKSRQENSRLRRSKNASERAKIREIRRQHKLGLGKAAPDEVAEAVDATEPTENAPQQAHDAPDEPQSDASIVEVRPAAGGWFEVYVGGELKTEKKVRKKQAEKLAAEYRNA